MDYGARKDGSKKDSGYFGELRNKNDEVMTEFSVGVDIDGKQMEIPTLVPTLSKKQVRHLLDGNEPTEDIVKRAVEHARQRIKDGMSPFFNSATEKRSTENVLYPGVDEP